MAKNSQDKFGLRSIWCLTSGLIPKNSQKLIDGSIKLLQKAAFPTVKDAKKTLAIVSGLGMGMSVLMAPAMAATGKLAVVKSPDNAQQWQTITNRLRAVGVDYCVLDVFQELENLDSKQIEVLFLPNVATISGKQVTGLQAWIKKGGKIIVSGPTGSLSQPDVRSRLRSLLGAYWGFPLVAPSTLEPLQVRRHQWLWKKDLAARVQGGVVIPAGIDSHTAAVWSGESTQPAVVVTEQSTFLGWRWGADSASDSEVDTAWLQAVISRYGDLPQANKTTANPCQIISGEDSQDTTTSATNSPASAPENSSDEGESNPNPIVTNASVTTAANRPSPPPRQPSSRGSLSASQVGVMRRELEALISRFESALLLADATHSDLDLATGEAIDKFFLDEESEDSPNIEPNQALQQARAGLDKFLRLVDQRDYQGARQEWFHTRRTLWDNYPSDRPLVQPEIRAIWLDRGTIVKAKSEADLAVIFDRLAAAGINTVFFETLNASYPIYPSEVAPEQNPLTQGWDPLKAAVKLAHERNMELHAWVWVFAAANQRHNTVLEQPQSYLGPVLSQHPEWANKDRRGRIFHPTSKKAFYDPANPELRKYLLELITEIATKYKVDGIQLDYIRYPFQDPRANNIFGYGKAARELFKQEHGVDPTSISPRNNQMWSKWTDFRIRQVDSFVAQAAETIRQIRPQLLISAAVFPIPQPERLVKLQQNWEQWAQNGDIDMVVAMTYATDTSRFQEITKPLFNQAAFGSSLLIPGIRLLNLPDAIALDQVQLLRDLPTGGYALFAAENLNENLQNLFSRIQGSDEPVARILPHRQPFKAAAARYQLLQREWSFLLANNQLELDETAVREWGTQADNLAKLLNNLAENPSMTKFLRAKLAISSFQRQFTGFMAKQAQTKPYQVEAWENRLATIARLINYGEQLIPNSEK